MYIIAVTVGISIIEKTWKGHWIYGELLGSEDGLREGALSKCPVEAVENGNGLIVHHGRERYKQQDIEAKCFEISKELDDILTEIRRRKRNRYSAEVSSLYAIFKDKQIRPDDCHIALLATDSPEGIFAARLNKRVIAHRLFGCDENLVLRWNGENDNGLDRAFSKIEICRIPGLQVKKPEIFEREGNESLEKVIRGLGEVYNKYKKVLNITGGFKGVIPIAVGIAWYYGWEVAYLYEDTTDYLIIPRPSYITVKSLTGDERAVPTQRHPMT